MHTPREAPVRHIFFFLLHFPFSFLLSFILSSFFLFFFPLYCERNPPFCYLYPKKRATRNFIFQRIVANTQPDFFLEGRGREREEERRLGDTLPPPPFPSPPTLFGSLPLTHLVVNVLCSVSVHPVSLSPNPIHNDTISPLSSSSSSQIFFFFCDSTKEKDLVNFFSFIPSPPPSPHHNPQLEPTSVLMTTGCLHSSLWSPFHLTDERNKRRSEE